VIIGAFTPISHDMHLHKLVEELDKYKEKGIDDVVCVCTNEPFVDVAWKKMNDCDGRLRILSDFYGELTQALGLQLDQAGRKTKRFSCFVVDSIIMVWNVEDDSDPSNPSLTENLLPQIEASEGY
jgi:glutaredoxin/glutathione-dependent peroxiredoxin